MLKSDLKAFELMSLIVMIIVPESFLYWFCTSALVKNFRRSNTYRLVFLLSSLSFWLWKTGNRCFVTRQRCRCSSSRRLPGFCISVHSWHGNCQKQHLHLHALTSPWEHTVTYIHLTPCSFATQCAVLSVFSALWIDKENNEWILVSSVFIY